MLVDDLYTTRAIRITPKGFDADISFDETHEIYKAHFPENPITPGVCMLEVCKQLIEQYTACTLFMKTVKNIKFLQVIVPNREQFVTFVVHCSQTDNEVSAQVTIQNDDVCFAKISIIYAIV